MRRAIESILARYKAQGGFYLDDLSADLAPLDLSDDESKEFADRMLSIGNTRKIMLARATRRFREQGMSDEDALKAYVGQTFERMLTAILESPDRDDFLRELQAAENKADGLAIINKYADRHF